MIRKYPSVFVLIFIFVGILIADISHLPAWLFLTLSFFFCISGFIILYQSSKLTVIIFLGLSLLFFSGFHYSIKYYDVGSNHIAHYTNQTKVFHIYGQVADWPNLKIDRTEIKIEVDSIADIHTYKVIGKILLRLSDTTTVLQRGDHVEFYGWIYPVSGRTFSTTFDYQRFLNLKGIFGIVYLPTLLDMRIDKGNRYSLYNLVDNLRMSIRNSFRENLSPTAAALASGFLIGETRDIPAEVYHRFRDSGTLHLLAVSGSNVALVVLFFIMIMRPFSFSRKKRSFVLLVVILIFNFLSYGEPSVMRASVMASLVILAGYFQRRYDLNNIIAATAVIILLSEPGQLFDIGFQLSFIIAWGLIFIIPRVTIYFRTYQNRWWYYWLVFPFLISVVAQLCSMGLIALYFHRLPVISPLANLIIVPMVSLAVVGIMFLLFANLILPVFGVFVGSFMNILLILILKIVEFMGGENIPMLKIPDLSIVVVFFFYVFLYLFFWSFKKKNRRRFVLLSLLVIVNFGLGSKIVNSFDNKTEATVNLFSIPGGVTAVIKQPQNDYADLIITGISAKKYPLEERIIYPQLELLGISRINSLFVLSAEYDAVDDIIRLTKKYLTKKVYLNRNLYRVMKDVLKRNNIIPLKFEIISYPDSQVSIRQNGFYPSKYALTFILGDTELDFSDRLYEKHFQAVQRRHKKILIIGKTWQISSEDWAKLFNSGFNKVICSKIAQPKLLKNLNNLYPQAVNQADFIYDLSRTGRFVIQIKKDQQ